MRAPNKARSIAKLSNDICMIYMAIHESGCLQGFARPQIRNPTKCEFIPDPLGDHLAKDLSDIYMYDARMRYYDDTQNLKAKTNTDFLKDLDGAELIDVMLAMTGPWGMSRFEDILHLHRKAGPELWNSFKTIYEKMRFWDKDLFQIPVPHIGNEVFEVPSERTKRRIIELKGPPEVPSERASRESWAKIEAKVSKIEISDTRIVQEPHASNFSGHLRDTANEMEVRKERDSQVQVRYGLNPNTSEAKHAQLRVVFVSNFSEKASMKAISKRIKEGALLSLMMYKLPSDNVMVCCIVFDMAQHAKDFIERNKVLEKTSGQNRFGKGSRICLGAPWPEDDEIRFMHAEGGGQRRRLTFACSGLFRRLPYSVFKQEIEKAAGPKNVELIWRLNAGNATVIFASVSILKFLLFSLASDQVNNSTVHRLKLLAMSRLHSQKWQKLGSSMKV